MSLDNTRGQERVFKGIAYDKVRGRWSARITFKSRVYQRYFHNEQAALDWYEQKSLELYGFDRVNKPQINGGSHD